MNKSKTVLVEKMEWVLEDNKMVRKLIKVEKEVVEEQPKGNEKMPTIKSNKKR
jgi:hypothetical protein